MSTEKPGKKQIFIVGGKRMSLDPLMVEKQIADALAREEQERVEELERKRRKYSQCPIYEPNPEALTDLALVNPTARINGAVLMEFEDTRDGRKFFLQKSIVELFFRRVKP